MGFSSFSLVVVGFVGCYTWFGYLLLVYVVLVVVFTGGVGV